MESMEKVRKRYMSTDDPVERFRLLTEYNARKLVSIGIQMDGNGSVDVIKKVIAETEDYRKELLESGKPDETMPEVDNETYVREKVLWCDYILEKLRKILEETG